MYTIQTEESFDAAHFLAGHEGKCRNLHGHRWRVVVEITAESLCEEGSSRGMVADFSDVRRDLRNLTDAYDHCFLYEAGSLRETTEQALAEEGFALCALPFRPTAEHLARHFYEELRDKGYAVCSVTVYETPEGGATYRADV